jgi:glycosyltransferase involved in cell wall biosynthesis
MKLLVFPRDVNPYQELLYGEMRRLGVKVTYLGQHTPSHGLNVLLLPVETAIRRLFGARLLHMHWVSPFILPGARRLKFMRRMSQVWFMLWLRTSRILGVRLIWTAHNVLPHDPVFSDDVVARRNLVSVSDLVLLHSNVTLASLAEIGALPSKSMVIPHGPFAPVRPAATLRVPGSDGGPCRFLFVGRVKRYKGVSDLLDAFNAMPKGISAQLTIAGQCDEPDLLARLLGFVQRPDISIVVGPERLSEERITDLLDAADVVVLPFRRITTSGSAILALSHGRPLILPDKADVGDLLGAAAIRYDGSVGGLSAALADTAATDKVKIAAMSRAALEYAYRVSWQQIAEQTKSAMTGLLHTRPTQGGSTDEYHDRDTSCERA